MRFPIAAGSRKLIAGQVADLEGEGKKLNRAQLRYIHENKTAALLTTSVRLGAMSANATPTQLRAISDFGYALGLAFQVIDDILDVTQTSEKLGKSAGKDAAAQKATYPAVLGLEKSRARSRSADAPGARRVAAVGQKSRTTARDRELSSSNANTDSGERTRPRVLSMAALANSDTLPSSGAKRRLPREALRSPELRQREIGIDLGR